MRKNDVVLLSLAALVFVTAHTVVWWMDTANINRVDPPEPSVVEPVELVEITPEPEPETCPLAVAQFYDVPLDEDLQAYIINECSAHDIDPALIMAMIDRESDFRPDVKGDGGRSHGLMQIQPRWHQERMDKLYITDLLDPYQNVTVGIDFLGELLDCGKGVEWALMAYNGGHTYANRLTEKGVVSDYAAGVLKAADVLTEGMI